MATETTIERVAYRAFSYAGVLWVPHYTKQRVYVAPGGVERHISFLEKFGAQAVTLMLWTRKWQAQRHLPRSA